MTAPYIEPTRAVDKKGSRYTGDGVSAFSVLRSWIAFDFDDARLEDDITTGTNPILKILFDTLDGTIDIPRLSSYCAFGKGV
jgi:hypothetical protein